jgi:hypothetical protein
MVTEVKMEVNFNKLLIKRIKEICGIIQCSELNETNKYLLIKKDGRLCAIDDDKIFTESSFKAVDPIDFIISNGEQEWLPKVGEEVEMCNDGKEWLKLTYLGYIPTIGFRPKYGGFFKYCRPIQVKNIITIGGQDIEVSKEFLKSLKEQLTKEMECNKLNG